MNRIIAATGLVLVFGAVAFVGFQAQQPPENGQRKPTDVQERPAAENAVVGPIEVTKQTFEAIKSGMTEADVRKIIGGDGAVQSDNGRIKIVSWREGTKLIGVTFRDGRMAGKTQIGL